MKNIEEIAKKTMFFISHSMVQTEILLSLYETYKKVSRSPKFNSIGDIIRKTFTSSKKSKSKEFLDLILFELLALSGYSVIHVQAPRFFKGENLENFNSTFKKELYDFLEREGILEYREIVSYPSGLQKNGTLSKFEYGEKVDIFKRIKGYKDIESSGQLILSFLMYLATIFQSNTMMGLSPIFAPYGKEALSISKSAIEFATVQEPENDYTKSISDYTKDININPNDANAYYNRGLTYEKLNRCNEAIADYTKTISIEPNNPRGYMGRGLIYLVTGEREKALADYKKACDLEDEDACSEYENLME